MRSISVGICVALGAALLSCSNQRAAKESRRQPAKAIVACPTDKALAELVAQSDLIVVALPDVPTQRLRAAMLEDHPDYVEVPLREASILKGASDSSELAVKVYPKQTTYSPAPEAVLQRNGKPTLLFLTRVDEGPTGLYFTHSLKAVRDASTPHLQALESELRRQDSVVTQAPSDLSLPHFSQVRKLLAELPHADPDQQASIFQKLESLGRDGVPAIVAQMDDRRPLAHQRISLVNHDPNAFEGLRHYSPELVVDALDAILNQITGFGGSIVNGGSERERKNTVAAWRVYAADMECE